VKLKNKIKALIFDFDGLILETEEPVYRSWQELFAELNCSLPFENWATIIGSSENFFDPFDLLEEQFGQAVNRKELGRRRFQRETELVQMQPILPGVLDYLQDAKRIGLRMAVASSSSNEWVTGHLKRLGIFGYFDRIVTRDDVERTKPDPELFLKALEVLSARPEQAIVFEDSPNGLAAAHAAGIFCVAVPNPLTRRLDLSQADLEIESLASLPLEKLLKRIEDISPTKM
jgi:HAD superfamily hydrolase (TIGR01509 family)